MPHGTCHTNAIRIGAEQVGVGGRVSPRFVGERVNLVGEMDGMLEGLVEGAWEGGWDGELEGEFVGEEVGRREQATVSTISRDPFV